jgi:hypothetical protein
MLFESRFGRRCGRSASPWMPPAQSPHGPQRAARAETAASPPSSAGFAFMGPVQRVVLRLLMAVSMARSIAGCAGFLILIHS